MKIWIYWSESNSWIYFCIVLNKNWKIYWSEQSFGTHREDWIINDISVINLRPNKIKVLVLGQCPLKISADGTFLLHTGKNSPPHHIFEEIKQFKVTAKFKFSSVPVTQTSFGKRLNDWSIENESKNSAWLRVKTLSSSVLMYSYVPNK